MPHHRNESIQYLRVWERMQTYMTEKKNCNYWFPLSNHIRYDFVFIFVFIVRTRVRVSGKKIVTISATVQHEKCRNSTIDSRDSTFYRNARNENFEFICPQQQRADAIITSDPARRAQNRAQNGIIIPCARGLPLLRQYSWTLCDRHAYQYAFLACNIFRADNVITPCGYEITTVKLTFFYIMYICASLCTHTARAQVFIYLYIYIYT